jgi:hypothetical protein
VFALCPGRQPVQDLERRTSDSQISALVHRMNIQLHRLTEPAPARGQKTMNVMRHSLRLREEEEEEEFEASFFSF